MKIPRSWDYHEEGFSCLESRQLESNRKEADSFRRHKETMKKFRQAHPEVEKPAPKVTAPPEPAKQCRTADLRGIVPVQWVQLPRFVQN